MRVIGLSMIASALSTSISTSANGQQLAANRQVMSSVVRIEARDCSSGRNPVGTGFLYRDRQTVVTALHVVAGCATVIAYSPARARSYGLRLTMATVSHDLALLQAGEAIADPLTPATSDPAPGQQLIGVGYMLTAATMQDRLLRVAAGTPRLGAMLPDAVRRRLERGRVLDLSAAIIRIDGTLVPGMSGGPIVDATGRLMGIANGGLDGGTVAISWAMRAQYLRSLSPTTMAQLPTVGDNTLFAAELETQPEVTQERLSCGDLDLALTRRHTLTELAKFDDDPRKGARLLRAFGITPQHAQALQYDIWTELQSGAAVALPAGTRLERRSWGCAASPRTGLYVSVLAASTLSLVDQDNRRRQFLEDDVRSYETGRMIPDRAWTDPSPRVLGKENMTVQRTAAILNPEHSFLQGYIASTVLTRGTTLIGAAVRSSFESPASDSPRRVNDKVLLGQILLGLHYSSFPPQ